MADQVERSLEDFVPIFEQLHRIQLFSRDEIQAVIKRCRQLEYRIQKQEKQADDFLRYAEYLSTFVRLLYKRRKKRQYWHHRADIDAVLNRKTDNVYQRVCERFAQDVSLWRRRIAFNIQHKRFPSVGRIYTRLLQLHSDNVELWIEAATFEWQKCKRFDAARKVLHGALRIHKRRPQLYAQLLRVELSFVEKVIERREKLAALQESDNRRALSNVDRKYAHIDAIPVKAQEEIVSLKLASAVVDEALSKCSDDLAHTLSLLHNIIVRHLPLASPIEERLREALMTDERLDYTPSVWVKRAQITAASGGSEASLFVVDSASGRTQCIKESFEVLERGIKKCSTNCADAIYEAIFDYIEECLREKNEDTIVQLYREFYVDKVVEFMKQRSAKKCDEKILRASMFMKEAPEQRLQLIEEALQIHPASCRLWSERILLALENGNDDSTVKKLFNKALKKVPPAEALPLWELGLQYAPDVQAKKDLLESAFVQTKVVSSQMKAHYLKLLALTENVQTLHKEFERLSRRVPNEKCFYNAYFELLDRLDAEPEIYRVAHEQCVREHGSTDASVWLSYAQWQLQSDALRVAEIYERALRSLKSHSECERFKEEYKQICA